MAQVVAGAILTAWMAEAVALGWAMGRRGFDAGIWAVIGVCLGPLSLVVAAVSIRKIKVDDPLLVHVGQAGEGAVDVLVGVDGSPESFAVAGHASALLGNRLGRMALATVIPKDASPYDEREADRRLAAAMERSGLDPSLVVLRGHPVDALRDYADRLGYELLAVGTRGADHTPALVGRVAAGLSRGSGTPVLLVDADDIPAEAVGT